jgi:pimeloyl-ACP methyl ester carboxylesterase
MAPRLRRGLASLCAVAAVAAIGAPTALAKPHHRPSHHGGGGLTLDWQSCTDTGWECATATVPKDYSSRKAGTLDLALTRLPAADQKNKIGSLFVNYGGPGGTSVDTTQAIGDILFGAFHDHFDIVAWDPRGVGQSSPSIDCKVNQEQLGLSSQPFTTPDNLNIGQLLFKDKSYIDACLKRNPGILPYVSTYNVVRDLDQLRQAVGDKKLNYFGFSYGTYIGAMYASLFPNKTRALVLDGAVDPDKYANRPELSGLTQAGAFEREIGRFFQACAPLPDVCTFAGTEDPWTAFDELVEKADAAPIPAGGDDPRPVTGDDIRLAALVAMYSKFSWPDLAAALNDAAAGDGTAMRAQVDDAYGLLPDGTYDPGSDRFFTISAIDSRWPRNIGGYLDRGDLSYSMFDHFWFNAGYSEVPWGLYPVKPRGVYYGPFKVPAKASTPLVVGTTYDPATPYRENKAMARELGNARLLTMRGDGHTAYFGNSQCIDDAVNAYVETLALPAAGTVCRQEVPFPLPEAAAARSSRSAASAASIRRFAGRGIAPFATR